MRKAPFALAAAWVLSACSDTGLGPEPIVATAAVLAVEGPLAPSALKTKFVTSDEVKSPPVLKRP